MGRPWCDIDWNASRPDPVDVRRSRSALRYSHARLSASVVDEMLSAIRRTHVNGGALLGQFRAIDGDAALHWFMSRNRPDEYGFFDHLFSSSVIRDALPQLELGHHGGAYEKYPGPAFRAKELAASFVAAVGY